MPKATNLWRDPRTGVYVWRRTNELTGRRFRKSTGTKILRIALAKVQQFEEEHERQLAGLSKFEGYRRPLDAFLGPFFESLSCGDRRMAQLRMELPRAFRLLGLDVLADIEDFTKIEAKLVRLNGKNGYSRTALARSFQAPLKQFSRYLAGRREMLSDHLAAWPALKRDAPRKKRRALLPDEMARALVASDCLDAMWPRAYPMRPVWTALLVAAPRVSALAALDVKDLDREKGRLVLKGNDIKRAGAANLDEKTLAEIIEYVGDRTEGPLFMSPEGERIDTRNSIRRWRMCVSLAMVDMEWPEDEPRDLRTEYLVHRCLPEKCRSSCATSTYVPAVLGPGCAPMSQRIDIWGSARNVIGGIFGVLSYLFRFAWLLLVRRPCSWRSSLQPRASSLPASMPSVD